MSVYRNQISAPMEIDYSEYEPAQLQQLQHNYQKRLEDIQGMFSFLSVRYISAKRATENWKPRKKRLGRFFQRDPRPDYERRKAEMEFLQTRYEQFHDEIGEIDKWLNIRGISDISVN